MTVIEFPGPDERRRRHGRRRGGRRAHHPVAREALAVASLGCRCERCWSGAEHFTFELGHDYGLLAAPGHEPSSPRLLGLDGRPWRRGRRYAMRDAELEMADLANRRHLEPLTRADLYPLDGLRARRYR